MSVAPPQDAILQGYLHKRSKHLKLWKVRYFILTKNDLLYSKKSGKSVKLCAVIQNVNVIDDQNAVAHLGNYVIELRSPIRKTFLSAATEQERAKWVMAMRSLQQDNSHHSATGARPGSSATQLLRPASESTIGALTLQAKDRRQRRKRGSKDRKEERKRRTLPKLKKSFSEVWVEDVLAQYPTQDTPLLKALCFAGIPKELRGRVWTWILGNRLQINEDLFEICKARAQAVQREMTLKKEADTAVFKLPPPEPTTSFSSSDSTTSPGDTSEQSDTGVDPRHVQDELKTTILLDAVEVAEKLISRGERSIRLVAVDMPRTFGHHPLFQTGADGTTRTIEVLEAYSCYRPDLGYVQGMSYLAAALCFHMDSFTAFKAMASLLSKSVLFDMFRMEEKRTFHYINCYEQILEFELPRLHSHFQECGIEPQMYAVDWALTLFTRSLPLNLAFRLWDCFVLLGTPFFFQASMGILLLFQERLLAMELEDMMRFLHHLPKTTTAVELFASIDAISLSCRDIDNILSGGDDHAWTPDSHRAVEVKVPDTYE